MEDKHVTLTVLVITFSSASLAIYLISDYYMDDGWSRSFGQVCGDTVGDDCAYINSHLNTFGLAKYDSDISCTMMLDAGKQRGARYKLSWKRFDLEDSTNCTYDSLTLYDGHINNMSVADPFDTFCGGNDPNTTGFPSQRYITIKFKTDGGTGKKGFRILATRTVPYPCPGGDFFHCKAENRCIDSRLHCDGTVQCDDETDEDGCTFWEKLIGGFLALGVAGIIGITGACLFLCISVGVIICICTCCRKRCGCLFRGCSNCWGKICSPVKSKLDNLKSGKVGVANDDVKLVDVDVNAAEVGVAGVALAGAKKTATKGTDSGGKEAEIATAREVVLTSVEDGKTGAKDGVAKAADGKADKGKGSESAGAVNQTVAANAKDATIAEESKSKPSDENTTSAGSENKTTTGLSQVNATETKEGVPKVDTQ